MLSLLCKDLCVFIVALRGKAETVFTSSLCCKFLCDIVTLWSEVCFLVLFECIHNFRPFFPFNLWRFRWRGTGCEDKNTDHKYFFHSKTSDSSSPTESIFSFDGYLSPFTPNIFFVLFSFIVNDASLGLTFINLSIKYGSR